MKKFFKDIRHNDIDAVRTAIAKNPKVVNEYFDGKAPKKDIGQSPLQVAIKCGQFEIIELLLENGADVNFMEAEDGLPSTISYRCPVLIDAIMGLFSTWKSHREDYLQLISNLLELGADPNKQDNRGCASWDWVLSMYSEEINRITDVTSRDMFVKMTKKLLEKLLEFNVEILNLEQIKKDLILFENHSLLLENLILNRNCLYGVKPDMVEFWNKYLTPIYELAKPYYVKNNPHYGTPVT